VKKLQLQNTAYITPFVYGSIDGTITTFAIIAGSAGANLPVSVILILGLANVFADAFSMASSNFLSEESRVRVEGKSRLSPTTSASVTFISFLCVGFIPLAPFVLSFFYPLTNQFAYGSAIILTLIIFLTIGYYRAHVANVPPFRSIVETFLIGSVAAGISFIVGYLLRNIS